MSDMGLATRIRTILDKTDNANLIGCGFTDHPCWDDFKKHADNPPIAKWTVLAEDGKVYEGLQWRDGKFEWSVLIGEINA